MAVKKPADFDFDIDLPDLDLPDIALPDLPDVDLGDLGGDPDDDDGGPEGEGVEDRGKRVLAEVQAGMQRLNKTKANYAATMEDDYWFAVYFPTREQKAAFLAAMKWAGIGDMYLRGLTLAEQAGIMMPATPTPSNPSKRINPTLAKLSMDLPKVG